MQTFELKILSQHWIKNDGIYDKTDICSHGNLFLKIQILNLRLAL